MNSAWCVETAGGVRLMLQIQPNARKSEVIGCFGDALKIRLHAQPIDGKANDVLITYLSDVLDIPKRAVSIMHGHAAKRKVVDIKDSCLTIDSVRQILLSSIAG